MTEQAAPQPKKRNGRPRIPIDWEQFDKLCSIFCTLEEIAGWFNCDEKTIETACKREKKQGFSDYYKSKTSQGKGSLRREQFKLAMKGNPTMLIWMGKQQLGQSDKVESKSDDKVHVTTEVDASTYTTEELLALKAIHETANARRDKQGTG